MTDESGPPAEMVRETTEVPAQADASVTNSPPATNNPTELAETASLAPDSGMTTTPSPAPEAERLESPKPRFKTNTVNMKFRTSAPAAETSTTSALSAPSTSRQSVSKLTLPNKKVSVDNNGDETRSRSVSVEPKPVETGASPAEAATAPSVNHDESVKENGADGSKKATSLSTNASADGSGDPNGDNSAGGENNTKHDYTEEELSNKGISVAGRFHSASNINWEDEEEEWQPQASMPLPSFGTSSVVSNLKSRKSPMRFDSSSVATSSVAEDLTAKPRAATLVASTSSDSQKLLISAKNSTPPSDSDGKTETETAWGARKQTVAPSSLADRIREAKSAQEPAKIVQKARTSVVSHHSTAAAAGNSDALNRFRIRAAPVIGNGFGRGPPPLNPRRLAVDEDEPRAFHMAGDAHPIAGVNFDFGRRGPPPPSDNFDFNRRLAPSDGSAAAPAPFSRGNLPPHRPIPARFLKPTAGGTAGASPFPRASSTVTSTSGAGASVSAGPTDPEPHTESGEPKQSAELNGHGGGDKLDEKTESENHQAIVLGSAPSSAPGSEPSASSAAPAGASVPLANVHPAPTWQAQKAAIQQPLTNIKEVQKKEMIDQLAALKARQEQRQREEEEKKRRIEEKLEQLRQEKLEKEKEENRRIAAAEAARKAEKEAEKERRAKEAAERAQRLAQRATERAAEESAKKAAQQTVEPIVKPEEAKANHSAPTANSETIKEPVNTPIVNEWEAEKERRRLMREESTRNESSRPVKLSKSTKPEKASKPDKPELSAGRVIKLPSVIECSGAFDVQALLRLKTSAPLKAKTMPRALESSVRVCLPTSEGKSMQPTLLQLRPNKSFKHRRGETARA